MPTTAAASDQLGHDAGFTLIELVVVLAIVSLLAAVATSAMRERPPSFGGDRSRVELSRALATAQDTARKSAKPQVVDLSAIGDRPMTVSATIGTATDRILVFADGSNTGGTIALAGTPVARLDWLTGRISDAR